MYHNAISALAPIAAGEIVTVAASGEIGQVDESEGNQVLVTFEDGSRRWLASRDVTVTPGASMTTALYGAASTTAFL